MAPRCCIEKPKCSLEAKCVGCCRQSAHCSEVAHALPASATVRRMRIRRSPLHMDVHLIERPGPRAQAYLLVYTGRSMRRVPSV